MTDYFDRYIDDWSIFIPINSYVLWADTPQSSQIRPNRHKFQVCREILVEVLFEPNYEREK